MIACISWMVAVLSPGARMAWSNRDMPGAVGPVIIAWMHARPAFALMASTTFGEVPDVEIPISTSPSRASARTCRANTSPNP